MSGAPVGAVVKLWYDSPGEVVVGDYIRTTSGRVYLVLAERRQVRGKRAGRHHLRCLVQSAAPDGARVWRLCWYPRKRKGAA